MQTLSSKLTHDKFRFHSSTIELDNDSVSIGGNNYKSSIKLKYISSADVDKVNQSVTQYFIAICESIHHRTLIPGQSPLITVTKSQNQVAIDKSSGGFHFSFPLSSVYICPILNCKIEDLCGYVGRVLIEKIKEKSNLDQSIQTLKIKIVQNIGARSATMKFALNSN